MITLREYQIDLIERSRARMREGIRRLLVQAPVGSGKTCVSSEIVRSAVARGKRVLFLAHRRRLITQKGGKLDDFDVPHGVLMSGISPSPSLPVQVASRDTLLSRSVRNDWIQPPPADLVIVDEAHRVLGQEYMRLLEMYPDAAHVGFTATPCRDDGKGLGDFYQAMECCLGIKELIAQGYLCPVVCFAPQNFGKRNVSKRVLAGNPVSHWQRLGEGRPTILFTSTVAASEAVCKDFVAAGIKAEHLDAHTPDAERDAIIARVERGETKILANCAVMIEGVDIPCLSCCILLRMAGSYVLFIQAIGRIMRSHPGKTHAILLDHSDAVLEHGFPDDDVRWELTTSETVDERNKKDKAEGKRKQPIPCPQCGYIFSGSPVCPKCNFKLPRRLQPPALKNQLLAEVDRTATPEEMHAMQVRHWHTCLRVMANKGMSVGAAAQMFRQRFKKWPEEAGNLPNIPDRGSLRRKVSDVFPQYVSSGRS